MQPATAPDVLAARLDDFRARIQRMRAELAKAIVGNDAIVTECLIAVVGQGHVLLEGVPGLGKTSLVKALARILGIGFGRVQCTPDLMPADILGTHLIQEDDHGRRSLRFERGPVFSPVLLVDEINRATPKTQAALLEVMQERAVTIGGERHVLPAPFVVLATQNPLEMEGTYPLPEAQLDRFFFKLRVPFPNRDDLLEISRRTTAFHEPVLDVVTDAPSLIALQELATTVPISEAVLGYAADLVLATHPDSGRSPETAKRFIAYGASPRGLQTLVRGARIRCLIEGRTAVSADDIRAVAAPALRHRIIRNFEGEAEGVDGDRLVQAILAAVPAPGRT